MRTVCSSPKALSFGRVPQPAEDRALLPRKPGPGVDFTAVLRCPWTQFNCIKQSPREFAIAYKLIYPGYKPVKLKSFK
jgi:hypothetical protein